MPSKPIERSGHSFSLRLNLWYAAFFIFGCFALFLLAYFVLASSIQQKEKEVIRARLEEYRAWYENGGLAGLSENFVNSRGQDRNAFFVRVVGIGNNGIRQRPGGVARLRYEEARSPEHRRNPPLV